MLNLLFGIDIRNGRSLGDPRAWLRRYLSVRTLDSLSVKDDNMVNIDFNVIFIIS